MFEQWKPEGDYWSTMKDDPNMLARKLDELSEICAVQAEVLATIATQQAAVVAAVNTAISTQIEILAALGVPKDQARKTQGETHAVALTVAHKSLETALGTLGKLRAASEPPTGGLLEN